MKITGKADLIYDGKSIQIESTNTLIGRYVGSELLSGLDNTFLGVEAGKKVASGSRNTFLGAYAGENALGNNNVFIGYSAGINEIGDDKLYISNTASSSPLIFGDFRAGMVRINDYLNVTKDLTVDRSALIKSNLSVEGSHSAYSMTINSPLPSLTFYTQQNQYTHRFYSHPSLDIFYLEDDENTNVLEIKNGELRLPEYGGTGTSNLSVDNNGKLIKTSSDQLIFNRYEFAEKDVFSNYTRLRHGVHFENGTILTGIKALIKDNNETGSSGVHNTAFVGVYRMNKITGNENSILPIYRIDASDTPLDVHQLFTQTTLAQTGANIIDNDTYIYFLQVFYCDLCSITEVEILK
ncbi:hypothetical protein [Portibacter lacus]|uniref:Uncharacterized protein n=2 Tax=Portibacter lacus TaxID=1099794 RepID=A0AA37WG90_9BACT|nr:hypothetical protein [Portibacter lacus]GLR18179.1 hypothetical protein GCM10007940_27940 [Portibacter lacus]